MQNHRADIANSLWNTWYCQSKVYTHEGRLYSDYCKNRFCTSCLGIRKADIINRYYPVLRNWQDAHFVTLTVKACTKKQLNERIEKCIEGFQLIIDRCRQRANRGKGKKLIGIRSFECNFNPDKYTYNPHFHVIVPDRETAELLVKEWLFQWTYKKQNKKPLASRLGQDIQPIRDIQTKLVEVVKYGIKVFTDPTNSKNERRSTTVYARAFYNIIVAMKGHRLFASFGFILPKSNDEEKHPAIVVEEYEEWRYLPEYNDWQHTESEQTLFGYMPSEILKELLDNNIDMEQE